MKTTAKTAVVLLFTLVALAKSAGAVAPPDSPPPASLGPAPGCLAVPPGVALSRNLPSADELAAYREQDRQFQSAAGQRAAGAAVDSTTIIVVAIIVAVAAVSIAVVGSNSVVIHP